MKKFMALTLTILFVFAMTTVSFAQPPAAAPKAEKAATVKAEIRGTVTKIDGKKLTIRQADGKEIVVDIKDTKGIKVGDRVTVKDGVAVIAK